MTSSLRTRQDPRAGDADRLRQLEEMRAAFERLHTERIRAESEVDRLSRELEQARAEAKAAFGTDDEGEILTLIEEARRRNAALIEEFSALIHSIEVRLRDLGEDH